MKFVVLDTNVLLFDPDAISTFPQDHVVIPITVIEELDTFKRDQTELGRNARMVTRFLDGIRKKGALSKGVELEGSLDYVATGLPRRGDVLAGRRFLDHASPWSFALVFVLPVAPW